MSKSKPKSKWKGKGRPPKPYENPIDVAVKARMRHTGLTEDQARHIRAGTVVGRLSMAGTLSDPLYEAAVAFCKAHAEVYAALTGPQGLEKTAPGTNPDEPSPEWIEWATATVGRYRPFKDRLSLDEWHAVEAAVINDTEAYILADLVSGLTVLAQSYGFFGRETGKIRSWEAA